jgi:Holliday junction DNA helicase RuvB
MSTPSRIVTPERRADDGGDTALRPQLLSEFVGQAQARANLSIFIEAARKRGEALDHVLFVGPPGLGKTTLAQIVARELGVGFAPHPVPSSPRPAISQRFSPISKSATCCSSTEIHRLSPAVEEVLYPAMEDFQLDLIIGGEDRRRARSRSSLRNSRWSAPLRAGL